MQQQQQQQQQLKLLHSSSSSNISGSHFRKCEQNYKIFGTTMLTTTKLQITKL